MNFKDCLYGQVRKLHAFPDLSCTDLPNDLASLVPKQEIITWNNATGMNPHWDTLPVTELLSYGDMIVESQAMGSAWINKLTHGNFSAADFEACVRDDYKNEITLICKRLAQWWMIDRFLNRPDALNYDFVIVRQIDTLFNPIANVEMLESELKRSNEKIFFSGETSIKPAVCYDDRYTGMIPICYDVSLDMERHPSSTMISSHAFILNRSAVITLKDNFYQLALNEIDHYYKLLGSSNYLDGDPGGIMHRICVKQNVEPISLRAVFLRPEVCRGGEKGGKIDFANLDRVG
jgi:hypothetical protein